MTERDILERAAAIAASAPDAALVTVVAALGSVPRRPPAKMVVRADGSILAGTVGGGRIELEAIAHARPVAAGHGPTARLQLDLARDLAMCCGGALELWIEPLDPPRGRALADVAVRLAGRQPSVLATRLDSSRGSGGKEVLADDESLRTRQPRLADDRFVEPVLPPARLVLFGGGHVAQAVALLAADVGFEIYVCEENEELATSARFPSARALVPSYDPDEVAGSLTALGRGDYAVIVTHDHAIDQAVLEKMLPRTELTYLGMLGSQGKVRRFRQRLEAKGLTDPGPWERLHAPVGLEIGADTPAEIAVSIVAQLIAVRAAASVEPPV